MFFWSVPAMKKSFRRKFNQEFELVHPLFPHASWSHVKRLKYRVLSKKLTEKKAKVVLIRVFFTILDQNVTNFDQHWAAPNQRKIALNSSESALFQRKSTLKQLWFSADFFALKNSSFRAVSEKISAVHLWNSSVSEKIGADSALISSSEM